MERFVCIHGHFYQPPRENPWLEEVEVQESAHPYHDWNQRVTAECYAPNTASRIMGPDRRIVDIVNNYSMISFNFGPTLLSWMERNAQETYEAILEADMKSRREFGHGSAIAQAYSHMIMPLANHRDRITQVRWGVADFKARFRRDPEGMWLPETAVDTPTLEALAQEGIKFTILAPHQAKRVRISGEGEWKEVRNGALCTNRPYLCRLPSGKAISIFFYNEAISKEVAFGGLLNDGEAFAKRIISGFTEGNGSQILSIATDGETYGHHHKFGEMALSYCLHYINANNLARLTNFGEFLEMNPPQDEVEIAEGTSWSCEHGVERWREECGCKTGVCALQRWRRPLREAMDWLRDNAAEAYENEMREYSEKPWDERDKYIDVVLDRSRENIDLFFKRNFKSDLSKHDRSKILKLLEMQRHSMLMQTSCGWFFDDISRIEAVQIMKHAARVVQLLKEVTGTDLEQEYLERLRAAKSNYSTFGDGAKIYEAFVNPSKVNLTRVGIHHAISSIFNGEKGGPHRVYCYIVEDKAYERQRVGKNVLITGNSRVISAITLEEDEIWYAALWLGDHNIFGGVRRQMGVEEFSEAQRVLQKAFQAGDVQRAISLIDLNFGKEGCSCSLSDLFKDRQIEVLERILDASVRKARSQFQQVYDDNLAVMTYMKGLSLKVPIALKSAAEVVLTYNMVETLREESDPGIFERLTKEAMSLQIELDKGLIGLEAKERIERELGQLVENPEDLGRMERLERLLRSVERLQLGINYWLAQNMLFQTISRWLGYMKAKEGSGDPSATRWIEKIRSLAEQLGIKA